MIGILGAMAVEIEGLLAKMDHPEEKSIGHMRFFRGQLHEREVVLAQCGIGKVNAAACAQAMIMAYQPELVINVGVGGSLNEDLHYSEVAVASCLVQHDVDTSTLGDPVGLVSTINLVEFPCDARAVELIAATVREMGVQTMVGPIASGDQFISSSERKQFIVDNFHAISCEMEGGAIAHVCYLNDVPCAVIRSISDNADEESHEDYPQFVARAVQQTEALMERLLPKI